MRFRSFQMAIGEEVVARYVAAWDAVDRIEIVTHQRVAGTPAAAGFELGEVRLPQSSLIANYGGTRVACTLNVDNAARITGVLIAESLRGLQCSIPIFDLGRIISRAGRLIAE